MAAPRTPRTPRSRSATGTRSTAAPATKGLPRCQAANPAKRWTETFFLAYSPVWIVWILLVLVPFKLYNRLDEWGYLAVGLLAALPCVIVPALYESKADAGKPWTEKYWVKANVWIAIFSFIGNYFWTHYFYTLLGASYTFPAHRLNGVPITLYFMTHAYFCLYHALANMTIRYVRALARPKGRWAVIGAEAAVVFALAYATAYGETLTIAHFPYYSFKNKDAMYTLGSLFYAIYFFVSFPMFFRMDEDGGGKKGYTLWRVVVDALAAGMLVTCLLDFWRLQVGAIYAPEPLKAAGGWFSLPWLSF